MRPLRLATNLRMEFLRELPIEVLRAEHPSRGFALTVQTSPVARRALPPPTRAQFVLRAAFLAATGVLFVVWLAAV